MCALTSSSISVLPLKADSVALWSKSTDLYSFLSDLYDDDGEIIDESGVRSIVNYRDYGDTLFERGKSSFATIASEFQVIAQKNRAEPDPFGNPIQIDIPPDFLQDPSFGLMAKQAVAWGAVVEALLSESQFFSLPHILEAREELDCSVLLAKNLYYKQALQVLRSLLELNVLHVYFVVDQEAYARWQSGQRDRLQVRGKGMLLQKLVEQGIIDSNLRKAVDELYEELNRTIHSTETKMVHRGLRDRKWAGLQFKLDDFHEWCLYVSRVVTVSVSLLLVMLEVMKRQPAPNGIVCDTCRALNEFVIEERRRSTVTLRCRRCGHQCSFDAEYASKLGYARSRSANSPISPDLCALPILEIDATPGHFRAFHQSCMFRSGDFRLSARQKTLHRFIPLGSRQTGVLDCGVSPLEMCSFLTPINTQNRNGLGNVASVGL